MFLSIKTKMPQNNNNENNNNNNKTEVSLNDVLNYVGIAIWKNKHNLFYQL